MNLPQKLFKEYTERMNRYSDEKIVEILNSEVGKGGWGTARASYLGALHKQLDIRKLDYSEIGGKESLSFKRKVRLEGKKIKVIPNSEPKILKGGIFKVDFDENEEKGYKLTPFDKRSTLF
jgi:hypothetical protein